MKTKILMVCLGNICRSPLAEGILASKLDPSKFEVASCGTSNYHIGKKPDNRSIAVAKKYGIDITQQKATQFTTSDFDRYDYIYPMDRSNLENILALARNEEDTAKVQLILESIAPNEQLEVPDPYYSSNDGFENVYKILNKACNNIKRQLQNIN